MLLSPADKRQPRIMSAALFGAGLLIWLATGLTLLRLLGAPEFSELAGR